MRTGARHADVRLSGLWNRHCVEGKKIESGARAAARALLETPLMARHHQTHIRQRCLRHSALGDFCIHDARFGGPLLAALPRLHNSPLAKCGCKKFCMDFHGDHTSTCTAHSGASKADDWMVSVLGPLLYGRTHGQNTARRHGQLAAITAGRRFCSIHDSHTSERGREIFFFYNQEVTEGR